MPFWVIRMGPEEPCQVLESSDFILRAEEIPKARYFQNRCLIKERQESGEAR